MTQALTSHQNNIVLGNGEIYFDRLDENDKFTGERYLGDSVGATLSVTTERTTIQSGDGAIAQDLLDIVRSVTREMGFTVRDSSIANWALFLIGDEADVAVAATAISDEAHGTVKKGTWIQLGRSASNPGGVGAVGAAADSGASGKTSVKSAETASKAAAATAQANKWKLDAASGRIQALADLYKVAVTYTPVAVTRKRASATTDARSLSGALRYIEDNPAGNTKGRSVYIRKCNLVPGGEAALKSRETEQQMAFTAAIQDPVGLGDSTKYPAVSIDGVEL